MRFTSGQHFSDWVTNSKILANSMLGELKSDAGADQRDQAGRRELIRERACKDSAAVLISLINIGIGMK